ncbi:DNA-binding transcriptional regulator [Luteolibacter sp. SL250]|uniref:AraC family transcriptional regulator n=1 Tax=Luteolibacter sp. SL250 TaxID=2995170 RepID=UPI002270F367|nr:DNA-binding transcriptional regulator [Luteolibacter sp. SL250]WAC19767.1 DNA-binding transcriptional regulator [Luteolibacter sp. SL250]
MIDALNGYGHKILDGISRYAQQKPEWRMAFFDRENHELADLVKTWKGDAIICTAIDDRFSDAAKHRDIPVINVTGRVESSSLIDVIGDAGATGEMAAKFLLGRGFRNLAFVANRKATLSEGRCSGFVAKAKEAGIETSVFQSSTREEGKLDAWLESLPKPLGLAATGDREASMVIEACWRLGIRVPGEVSVLGIGNYEQLCELSSPTLSSLEVDMERRGYEAARLLNHIFSGGPVPEDPILIPPAHVVERQSTNVFAFEDEAVVSALQFIRENAFRTINVKDVVAATTISRRSLEGRFSKLTGRTLHEEIWQAHFDLATRLLASSDLSLQEIAERSGFRTASALVNLFRQRFGVTPKEYRIANRR